MRRAILTCLSAATMVLVGAAAAAAPRPPAAPSAKTSTPASGVGESSDAYIYQVDGRRDPFLSLIATGTDQTQTTKKSDGIATLAVNDLAVRGVLKSKGTLIAMVQGPDRRAYVVHQGDAFLDGSIKAVIPEGLVIVQQVNDPLSLVKQREVRKLMRAVEDGKQ